MGASTQNWSKLKIFQFLFFTHIKQLFPKNIWSFRNTLSTNKFIGSLMRKQILIFTTHSLQKPNTGKKRNKTKYFYEKGWPIAPNFWSTKQYQKSLSQEDLPLLSVLWVSEIIMKLVKSTEYSTWTKFQLTVPKDLLQSFAKSSTLVV